MKSSVFNTLTYQHMVNSNNKLKFYTVQNELTTPSNILELMVASPTNADLRGKTSVKPSKQLFVTPEGGGGGGCGDMSPRQVSDWSLNLEEYMPRPYNRGKRPNVAMPVVLRNKTPFTRLSPEIVPQKRGMETSYLRFLYRTYTLPHNKNTDVLEKLPSGDSPINNSEPDDDDGYQQQASRNTAPFYYELMRGITRLDLQTCINGFITSLQRLAAIILNMISNYDKSL
ncbi:uncharacterized protein [Drosophila virilis]|uniref:Uncharacterized protein, isoform B n=1 Tax=Drosophila virilis TaxID=7244 RepID=B4M8P7_DROVI|nr:uncharacterized protein LOC6634046 isoform X2 [Drosophila virilis]EDW57573.2 uncharacterized protein Dvir_GJ18163, isoform B [Drosophila virilis]